MEKILEVQQLSVSFDTYAGEVQAVRDVSFDLEKSESLAIVGESGSGKSVTAQSIMRLVQIPPGRIKSGRVIYNGEGILSKTEKEMRSVRGARIAMIFQDPMTSLNPTMTVGMQIAESLILHQKMKKKEALAKAAEMLALVNIPNAHKRITQYPHQFSGGMRQRVMIAMALSCNPDILIADEPTTSLDVTIQAQIMDLLRELKNRIGMSVIIITHDMGVVADFAKRVIVMYGGRIMEQGSVADVFKNPSHPYTIGLLRSVPGISVSPDKPLATIDGTPPDMLNPPDGCPFAPRCKNAMRVCAGEKPDAFTINADHVSSCWLHHPDVKEVNS